MVVWHINLGISRDVAETRAVKTNIVPRFSRTCYFFYDHDMPFSFTFKLSVPGLSNPFSTEKAVPYHSPGRPTAGSILIDTPAALNPPRRYPSSISKSPTISRKRGWEPTFSDSIPTPPSARYRPTSLEDSYQEVMASDTGGFHNALFVFNIPSLPSRVVIHTAHTCFSVYHPIPPPIASIYHHPHSFSAYLMFKPTFFQIDAFDRLIIIFHAEMPPPTKRRRGLAGSIVDTAFNAALIGTAVGLTMYRLYVCPLPPLSNHPTPLYSWRDRGKGPERLPPPPPYQPGEWISEQDKHQRQAASQLPVPTSPPPPISPPPIHVIPTTPRNHRKTRHIPGVSPSAGKRSVGHRRTVRRGAIPQYHVTHHHQPTLSSSSSSPSALFPPSQPEFDFEPVDDEVRL